MPGDFEPREDGIAEWFLAALFATLPVAGCSVESGAENVGALSERQGSYDLIASYNDAANAKGWIVEWQIPELLNEETGVAVIGQWYNNLESGVYHTGDGWFVYYFGDDNGLHGNNPNCDAMWGSGSFCYGIHADLQPGQQVAFKYEFCTPQHVPSATGTQNCLYVDLKDGGGWRFLAEDTNVRPEAVELDPATAWTFLGEGAALLAEAGFGVIVPGELTAAGQRRLRLRMRVGGNGKKVAGVIAGTVGLALDELLQVDWEAVIGDEPLTASELAALARQKAPLVQFRGAWVAIDPRELGDIQKRLAGGASKLTTREAIQAVLAGEARQGGLSIAVTASGVVAELVERLRNGGAKELGAPRSLLATLRPYQERGLNWLVTMGSLGLGACLADDMGLGKTMQLLAFLLHRKDEARRDARPALLIAPTSVVGNWEREVERFAPSLDVVRHYGASRARSASDIPRKPGTLVVTTYGLLRRDAELLSEIDWSVAALDEAQNIKNASSATARAARGLRASHRFALTGTPVENRLAELCRSSSLQTRACSAPSRRSQGLRAAHRALRQRRRGHAPSPHRRAVRSAPPQE